MNIEFNGKEEKFEMADGWHRCVCKRVAENDPSKVRLIFSKLAQTSKIYDYVAGKTFDRTLEVNSELRECLLDCFGEKFSDFIDENNEMNPQALVGHEVYLRTENRKSPKYPRPFCNIAEFASVDMFSDN